MVIIKAVNLIITNPLILTILPIGLISLKVNGLNMIINMIAKAHSVTLVAVKLLKLTDINAHNLSLQNVKRKGH